MTDLKKPRLTAKNENGGCTILGADQIDIECGSVKNAILISNCLYRLFELENAIESGELAEVVHGKWELVQKFKKPDVKKCSNCGYEEMILITDENKKRCPNCGAKMDGKDGE